MKTILLGLIALAVVGGIYFWYLTTSAPEFSLPPESWLTYDGGSWTIQYPPHLNPYPVLKIVSFKNLKKDTFIGVRSSSISQIPGIAGLIEERDPKHENILFTILEIKKEQAAGLSQVTTKLLNIESTPVAYFSYIDRSSPEHPSFDEEVTFLKGGNIGWIDFSTNNADKPDPETQAIFRSMAASFQLK